MTSPLAPDLALVYSPLLPVTFREVLLQRGIGLVEVAEEEFEAMAGNVLALAPRRCARMQGHPITRGRLEDAGVAATVELLAVDERRLHVVTAARRAPEHVLAAVVHRFTS